MKVDDLMIGDWVVYDKEFYRPTLFGTVSQLITGKNGDFIEIQYGKSNSALTLKNRDYRFDPIVLTPEILELNGFVGDRVKEYRFEEDGTKYAFYLKEAFNNDNVQDGWMTNICGVLPSVVTYVHELQHLLKHAGLNDLAKNFKVC